MRSGTVYKVPCTCGKYYIGESIRRLETRLAEHKEACYKGDTHKSTIADHAWSEQHAIEWDNTTVIDRSSNRMNLMLKEALHIQLGPKQQQMNRDSGTDIPGCWVSTISGMHVMQLVRLTKGTVTLRIFKCIFTLKHFLYHP